MKNANRQIALCGVLALLAAGFAVRRASGGDTPGRTTSGTLDFGGRTRTYLLHLPVGYDGNKLLPMVVVLHGGTQSPESAERMSGMSAKANKEHFIAVYPRGTGRLPTWNAGNCCGYAMDNKVDDIGFLVTLIDKLEHGYAVDANRVYFTGISNGAMMTYRVGCEMSSEVAAIAPVEGAQNVDCRPAFRVSVIAFHGTADRLVPFNGGSTPYQLSGRRDDNSVANAISFWVKRDGCDPAPKRSEVAQARVEEYSQCKDGTGVALYAIQGGRHMWPGLRVSGNQVPATDLMWSFFAAHPKS